MSQPTVDWLVTARQAIDMWRSDRPSRPIGHRCHDPKFFLRSTLSPPVFLSSPARIFLSCPYTSFSDSFHVLLYLCFLIVLYLPVTFPFS